MTERKRQTQHTTLLLVVPHRHSHSLTSIRHGTVGEQTQKATTSPTHSGHTLRQPCLHPSKDQSPPSYSLMKVDPLFFFCPSVSKQTYLILSDANHNNNSQPKANPTSPPQPPNSQTRSIGRDIIQRAKREERAHTSPQPICSCL